MYTIKSLDELEIGDRVIIIDFNENPIIVTVRDIEYNYRSFTYNEDVWDVSLEQIAVLNF